MLSDPGVEGVGGPGVVGVVRVVGVVGMVRAGNVRCRTGSKTAPWNARRGEGEEREE